MKYHKIACFHDYFWKFSSLKNSSSLRSLARTELGQIYIYLLAKADLGGGFCLYGNGGPWSRFRGGPSAPLPWSRNQNKERNFFDGVGGSFLSFSRSRLRRTVAILGSNLGGRHNFEKKFLVEKYYCRFRILGGGHFLLQETLFQDKRKGRNFSNFFDYFQSICCRERSKHQRRAKPPTWGRSPCGGIPKGGGGAPLRIQNFLTFELTTAFRKL